MLWVFGWVLDILLECEASPGYSRYTLLEELAFNPMKPTTLLLSHPIRFDSRAFDQCLSIGVAINPDPAPARPDPQSSEFPTSSGLQSH